MTAAESPPSTPAKQAIARYTIDAEAGTGTLTFANGKVITVHASQVHHSKVPHLANELLLMGMGRELASAYNVKRENADEAYTAAAIRLESVLTQGRGHREAGAGSMSALDVAVAVVAELKNRTVEAVRAIIDAYTDATLPDGTVFTADQKRKAFVQKVKTDPQTAAQYAAKRHPVKAKSSAKPSVLDEFA